MSLKDTFKEAGLQEDETLHQLISQIQSELLELIDEGEIKILIGELNLPFSPYVIRDLQMRLSKAISQQCKQAIRGYCQ